MTKKDYEALAAALRKAEDHSDPDDFRFIVQNIANILYADNPKFSREVFYRACGIEWSLHNK